MSQEFQLVTGLADWVHLFQLGEVVFILAVQIGDGFGLATSLGLSISHLSILNTTLLESTNQIFLLLNLSWVGMKENKYGSTNQSIFWMKNVKITSM